MNQPYASQIPLATAAEYLNDPKRYDAMGAFARACPDDQTAAIAHACYDGPCNVAASNPIAVLVAKIVAINSPTERDALHEALLFAKTAAKKTVVSTSPFALEVAPWAHRIAVEARAGIAALNVLDACEKDQPDVLAIMGAMFAMTFHWAEARRSEHIVFGPRFALYPAIVMHHSGQPAFLAREGILEDRNAIDALCRHACAAADSVSSSSAP